MTQTLSFKTNTLLKNLVGRDLINDDNIAIVELVKNSYDARSDQVLIRFEGFGVNGKTTDSSRIVIADEGSGMDLSDIQDKWLNIAYSDKKITPQHEGDFLAGNKGVGRFSCDRLGTKLDLFTRVKGGNLLHLPVNWLEFEREGEKDLIIQDIPLKINTVQSHEATKLTGLTQFPKKGTILVISNLRSVWDHNRLLGLKKSLEKFLNPNQLFERSRFTITLSAPDLEPQDRNQEYHERVNGKIQNQIFDKLKFNSTYIEVKVLNTKGLRTIHTELHHEGEPVFRLVEENTQFPLLNSVRVMIYYLNPYKKAYFKRQTGVRLVDFGSVFLFLNGFRIAPYGDRGDDWLSLDIRKSQGVNRYLGSRDVVGRIEVFDMNENFVPISSREGLKNTEAFIQLRDSFFLSILRKLEKFVVDGLEWDSVPKTLRQEVAADNGLDWDKTTEEYVESWERKRQRIALNIMTLIGSSPEHIKSFWFNPSLLEGILENRIEETKQLLQDIEGYESQKVDEKLKKSLSGIRALITKREAEAAAAKRESAQLRQEVVKKEGEVKRVREEKETYRAQTLFLQSVSSLNAKELTAFHHQISQDSGIVENFLGKALKELRGRPNTKIVAELVEKAIMANKRITAVSQFAIKANFRASAKKEPTDIPAFIEQYIKSVAREFVAVGVNVIVVNEVRESFEVKVSRIELTILIDNIISNAKKAQAKGLKIHMKKLSENTLCISFMDDGRGLSKDIEDVKSIFEMGFTTTSGSGLGLYHARSIVEKMDGVISARPLSPKGMEIRVEVTR